MKKVVFDTAAAAALAVVFATPAFAGCIVPAPVAGVGLGALVILGLGYRALRKRIDG
jgi:hypothetical protein